MRKKVGAICLILCMILSLVACKDQENEFQNGTSATEDSVTAKRNIDGSLTIDWCGPGAVQAAKYFQSGQAFVSIMIPLKDSEEYYKFETSYFENSVFSFYMYHSQGNEEMVTVVEVDYPKGCEDMQQVAVVETGLQFTLTAEQYRMLPPQQIEYLQIQASPSSEEQVDCVTSKQYSFSSLLSS